MVTMYRMHEVPSLNGKSKEKTFVPIRVPDAMAFDEALPKEKKSDGLEAVLRVLAKLSPDSRQAFFDSLDKIFGAEDDLTAAEEPISDEPPAGLPRPGGKMHDPLKNGSGAAMDSAATMAAKSYAAMFPEAAHIKVDTYGCRVPSKRSPKPMSEADAKRYYEMFPGAARLK